MTVGDCPPIVTLLEEGEDSLVGLVGLGKHSLACLSKDIVVGVSNHLSSHICITDSRFSRLGVLNDVVEVCNCMLKSVLNCTECRSLLRYFLNSSFDGID